MIVIIGLLMGAVVGSGRKTVGMDVVAGDVERVFYAGEVVIATASERTAFYELLERLRGEGYVVEFVSTPDDLYGDIRDRVFGEGDVPDEWRSLLRMERLIGSFVMLNFRGLQVGGVQYYNIPFRLPEDIDRIRR